MPFRMLTFSVEPHSHGVYISIFKLIRFVRVCTHVNNLNVRNKCTSASLLKHDYRYHQLQKAFAKFYRRHNELVYKLKPDEERMKAYRNQSFTVTEYTKFGKYGFNWVFLISLVKV